jgi:hypothetical protein
MMIKSAVHATENEQERARMEKVAYWGIAQIGGVLQNVWYCLIETLKRYVFLTKEKQES